MSESFRNVARNNLHVKAKYIAQIVSHDIMSMTMFGMVIRLFAKNTLPHRLPSSLVRVSLSKWKCTCSCLVVVLVLITRHPGVCRWAGGWIGGGEVSGDRKLDDYCWIFNRRFTDSTRQTLISVFHSFAVFQIRCFYTVIIILIAGPVELTFRCLPAPSTRLLKLPNNNIILLGGPLMQSVLTRINIPCGCAVTFWCSMPSGQIPIRYASRQAK